MAGNLYKEVSSGKNKFFYLEYGDSNKRTLLCLHGYADNAEMFQELGEKLQDNYRVIALDFPMARENSHSYDLSSLTDYVFDFISTVGIRNFDLFGFSLGGLVAINVADIDDRKSNVFVANMVPTIALNYFEKNLVNIIAPIFRTKFFCYFFSRIRLWSAPTHTKAVRNISGALSRIKENYYSVFSTLFSFGAVNLTANFNNSPDAKYLFFFKDDKVLRYSRYQKAIEDLKCNKFTFNKGGHLVEKDYWSNIIPIVNAVYCKKSLA